MLTSAVLQSSFLSDDGQYVTSSHFVYFFRMARSSVDCVEVTVECAPLIT